MSHTMRDWIDLVGNAGHRGMLAEMAAPSPDMRGKTFYHGCPNDAAGRSILEHGLRPGNQTTAARGHLTPVVGRTYLTAHLAYGIIYCVGGDMLGCSEDTVPYLIGRAGPIGWLFVVDGTTLVADVQPDEDSVGKAAMLASRIVAGDQKVQQYYGHDPLFQGLAAADPVRLRQFVHNARVGMTPKQWKDACDGLVAAQAAGGKRALKTMSDEWKLWLIGCGAHVAHQGPVMPDQAWRFDKHLTPRLAKDGSNFFELAERVR